MWITFEMILIIIKFLKPHAESPTSLYYSWFHHFLAFARERPVYICSTHSSCTEKSLPTDVLCFIIKSYTWLVWMKIMSKRCSLSFAVIYTWELIINSFSNFLYSLISAFGTGYYLISLICQITVWISKLFNFFHLGFFFSSNRINHSRLKSSNKFH